MQGYTISPTLFCSHPRLEFRLCPGGCIAFLDNEATSDHLGGIATPTSLRIENFTLHQEGVGVEHDVVAHANAIMHESPGADRAAVAEADVIGFKDAFLQRVRLQHTALIKVGEIADFSERALCDRAAAIEHFSADFHAHGAKDNGAEWRA